MSLYYFSPKLTYSADPNSIGIHWSLELLLDNSAADGIFQFLCFSLRAHISLDRLLNTLYSLGKPLSNPATLGPKRVFLRFSRLVI